MANGFDDEELEIDEVEGESEAAEGDNCEELEGFFVVAVEVVKGNEEDCGVIGEAEVGERDAEDFGVFAGEDGVATAGDRAIDSGAGEVADGEVTGVNEANDGKCEEGPNEVF